VAAGIGLRLRPPWEILSNTWQAHKNYKQLSEALFGAHEFHMELLNYDVPKIPT
jgi:hypothetical protein